MTENLLSPSTHAVTLSQPTIPSPKLSHLALPVEPSKTEAPEEEPYTIKCICGFTEDDGNTIFCEVCETWQHIECFYPNNIQDAYREDFDHLCADCKPRPLDHARAAERQRLRKQAKIGSSDTSDKNKKRPPSKNQKKKSKPSDVQVNGHGPLDVTVTKHSQDINASHQHKKSKSTHKPSHSISSHNPKRSPPLGTKHSNLHIHPPSPATTPPDMYQELEIHNYSSGFLSLYKDDSDISTVQTSSFASLNISNILSIWLRDHDRLKNETGHFFDEVFQTLPADIESVKKLPVVGRKKTAISPDTILHWQYLTTPHGIEKDVPLVELNGQIGIQKNYCEDLENRWSELSCPLPFVFFHPMLPLYIDTRKEGSVARYVRRSCKPNAELSTFLSDGSEYHFWLVSDRKIFPREQITIPWDFHLPGHDGARMLELLGLGEDDTTGLPEYDPNEIEFYRSIQSWVYTVLSEYGGCACDLGSDCAFRRFHRTYINRSSRGGIPKKKLRKPKQQNMSPSSTGQATNSRAPSEGNGDGVDDDSGSSRSKPPSRDMTPAPRQGSFDTMGVLTELTDRDKRKVQMVEDSFRRMEQQQPPRKKKRTSDGNSSSGASTKPRPRTSTSQASNGGAKYVDAGTGRRASASPSSATSPTSSTQATKIVNGRRSLPLSNSNRPTQTATYVDSATQTEPCTGQWYDDAPSSPLPKRRVVSLSKRLLASRYRLKAEENERRRSIASPTAVASVFVKMDLDSPSNQRPSISLTSPSEDTKTLPAASEKETSPDTAMADAPSEPSIEAKDPVEADPTPETSNLSKIAEPRAEPSAEPSDSSPVNGDAPVSCSEELGPTAPGNQALSLTTSLPSSLTAPALNGNAAQPSPVKKKLSLSDYKSRMQKAAGAKPASNLKPPSTIPEDVKSPTSIDTVMLESPVADKKPDN